MITRNNIELELVEIVVDITGSPDNVILFDVILAAGINIAETVKRNRETDDMEQWFRISCSAELEDGIKNFSISNISINSKHRKSKDNRLSEYLVPVISKEELDDTAEAFLKKYYPEALEKPMAIPPEEVAERMGLQIK